MGCVMDKVGGGTDYPLFFYILFLFIYFKEGASVIAPVVCTGFIFHWYYKLLATDIIIKQNTSLPLSLFQYLFQKPLVSCVTGWYAQMGLESEGGK